MYKYSNALVSCLIVVLLTVIITTSCEKQSEDVLFPSKQDTTTVCDTNNVSYSKSISKINNTQCAVCHSPNQVGARVLLENYSQVSFYVTIGRYMVVMQDSKHQNRKVMPSACDLKMLKAWINQGAKNN